ncbi:WYL domain-containing protein, partial [bacterium]|nr:WYL domain-containing protein [bacterium]
MSRTERIHAIDDFIKRYGKVTKQRLVDYLEVSKESIKKDIAYMRDFLRAPIEYDSKIRGYIYTKPYEYLSFASEETILFHVFMKALAEDLEEKGMNYIPVVPKDILKDLSQNIREEYLSVMDQIEYHSSAIEQMDRKLILSIIQAMRHKNKLKVHYTNAKGEESDRELEPYKLLNYQGNWYVIAYCSQRESLATFLVARIDKLAVLDAKFDS